MPPWTKTGKRAEMGGMSTEAQPERSGEGTEGLFGVESEGRAKGAERPGGRPRLQCADRHQVVMRCGALDEQLSDDHTARMVWAYVESMNLEPLHRLIKAVEGRPGRKPIDPRILLALWIYATLDGVGSAREIDRLCQAHRAYEWICGGVGVNYHSISDFRSGHVEFLDQMLSDSVAALMHEGLVSLNRVAQDGMRVRASAGAASFRRAATLEECQAQAQEQVQELRKDLESDPAAASQRQRAARERGARERAQRIGRALEEAKKLGQKRQEQIQRKAAKDQEPQDKDPDQGAGSGQGPKAKEEPKPPRVSTTDPEAKVMKMADGGFRPAFNVQYASDTASQIVTGVGVNNIGSDMGQIGPMVGQHQERYGRAPQEVLVDGGFSKKEDIEQVGAPEVGVKVFAPVQKPRVEGQDPHQRRRGDSDVIAEWRERMGTAEAKAIYKERASTAECVNAAARNRGLRQFLVRGMEKVRAVALWFALAHNLVRAAALRAEAALRAQRALASG